MMASAGDEDGSRAIVPVDLYRFGNRHGPRDPRRDLDIRVDAFGMVDSEVGRIEPAGVSTVADFGAIPFRGHFHRLARGTTLPPGLQIVADGRDVQPLSHRARSHHTIYPSARMSFEAFVSLVRGLPWEYAGEKR